MRTFGEAVAQLRGAEAGGFSFSVEQAGLLLQEGVDRFASRSKWIKAELDLGTTIADQEQYELPSTVVELLGLTIEGVPYNAVDVQTIWQYKLVGLPQRIDGAYAERFNDDGKIKAIGLLPVPDADGLSIAGLAVVTPGQLADDDELPFPAEFRRGPLDYAKGIAYEELDENPEAGAYYIERADTVADELRRLAQSRTGSGPYQIPVASARGRR